MGNFLVYRELERPFPPGEKKRANRQRTKSARTEPYSRSSAPSHYSEDPPYEIPDSKDRKITGSLVDSYDFKRGGLLKRTLSVIVNGCTHHLIAYYTIEDAKDQSTLFRPGHDHRLANCHPRKELITDQKFRTSLDYQPYPHETSYTTATGSAFGQNFGFEQSSHGISSQPQYHGSISDMSEDSQVSPDHMFGEGPVQPAGAYPCYSSSEAQHSRHDTLGAFDEKAPHFSNNFS
ncbi:putative camp independent regulatory protein [Diplodia seriata]|uniref:Putative camp independent regulatory protein n=1 Tax=Diplodia seriata TaxID=420778 RepID=A0A0G2GLJ0_9PEZI|nr:putative camp independent regulatory protein [Diplodia seriata]